MNWSLEWNGEQVPVDSAAELDGLLDRLQTEGQVEPFIVHLNSPSGTTINIGIGGEQSVLNYIAENGSASFTAVGNEEARGTVQFRLEGEISEFLARYSVPIEQARQAARYFFNNQGMTPDLTWEQD